MFDLDYKNDIIKINNCDKDGSIVVKRLASIFGCVAPTRDIKININRETNKNYPQDMGNKLVEYYNFQKGKEIFKKDILILSSVHRFGLYLAEVLHGLILPLQIMAFANSWSTAETTSTMSICGTDYDKDCIWQWNKFTTVEDLPSKYLELIKNAESLIIVRSIDSVSDCPIIGKYKNLHINSTLKNINHGNKYLEQILPELKYKEKKYEDIRQWEFGLPDESIKSIKHLWSSLSKNTNDLHIIEDTTINLYKSIIPLWEKYLLSNGISIRGFTFNSYWTTHPYYEKLAGLLPINFYKFSTLSEFAKFYFEKYIQQIELSSETINVYTNQTGSQNDIDDLIRFLKEFKLEKTAWFSIGYDCMDKNNRCTDIYGENIPKPFERIKCLLNKAPYYSRKFYPLSMRDIKNLFPKRISIS